MLLLASIFNKICWDFKLIFIDLFLNGSLAVTDQIK